MQIIAAKRFAGGAFTLLEAGQYPPQVADGGARISVEASPSLTADGAIAFWMLSQDRSAPACREDRCKGCRHA
jgi:hypothetical protein